MNKSDLFYLYELKYKLLSGGELTPSEKERSILLLRDKSLDEYCIGTLLFSIIDLPFSFSLDYLIMESVEDGSYLEFIKDKNPKYTAVFPCDLLLFKPIIKRCKTSKQLERAILLLSFINNFNITSTLKGIILDTLLSLIIEDGDFTLEDVINNTFNKEIMGDALDGLFDIISFTKDLEFPPLPFFSEEEIEAYILGFSPIILLIKNENKNERKINVYSH